MANKNAVPPRRTITATKLLQEAFEKRYGTKESPKVAVKSWYLYSRHLKYFLDYISLPNVYDSVNALTVKSIYNYREYLYENSNAREKVIAQECNTIILLINDICANPNYQRFNLKPIKPYKKVDNIKKAEKKKRDIPYEDIKAVNDLDLSNNEKLATYRDIFYVQLQSGVRFEDLNKLFTHDYKVSVEDGYVLQTIISHKETITAVVIVNDKIKEIQTKYENGLPFELKDKLYNKAIKELFEMAGCTYCINFGSEKKGVKNQESKRFCDVVTNSWTRQTFITDKVRKGWSYEKVTWLIGHANDQQVKAVYAQLNETDKAKQVIKELRKIEN